MRKRMFELVERAEEGDVIGYVYDIFIAIVALLSISPILFRAGAMSGLSAAIVDKVDLITVYILLLDYLMRWLTYDMHLEKTGVDIGRKAFLVYPVTPLAIIDIISLLPTLFFLPEAFKFLRLLRLFKLFRVLRSLSIIAGVFVREARTLLSVLVVILLYVLSTALMMYSFEPDTFPTLLDAFYWASTAMATIGYGDLCPQTDGGKIVSILSTIVGIVVVSLPAGIITGGYVAEMRRLREKGKRRHRALDVDTGFDERLVAGVRGVRKSLRKRSVLHYFLDRPKMLYYFFVMALALVLDVMCGVVGSTLDLINDFDFGGIILASALLEPAAGIIVAFFNTFVWAFLYGDSVNVLYMCGSVVMALCTSLLFWRTDISRGQRVGIFALMTLVIVLFDYLGSFTSIFGLEIARSAQGFVSMGIVADMSVAKGIVLFLYWVTMMVIVAAWYVVARFAKKHMLVKSFFIRTLGSREGFSLPDSPADADDGPGAYDQARSRNNCTEAESVRAPLPSQTQHRRINYRSRYR